ncbi:MAG: Flp pilus assembly complex ATPase component TadA [Ruminococcus sp.]|nr:Flp pilus assembly complex ATPase component TadA [Ruminococcus sp.]
MIREANNRLAQAAGCLSPQIYRMLSPYFSELENKVQEIRLRVNRPVALVGAQFTGYLTENGALTDLPGGSLLKAGKNDLEATVQRACEYSVYARQRELREGFVTLRGGHRLGICGTAVQEAGEVRHVRDYSSLNLRIARELRGCGERIFREVAEKSGGVLLCGAPCSGKTTLLRDVARLFSVERGCRVSLIDERGELAATCMGEPQNDVGFCDVFDGYPKAKAMEQALRCMSPDVIVCDEIGGRADCEAICGCLNSGVRVIAAAHASDERELYARPLLREILASGAFETFVFLRGREHAGEVAFVRQGHDRCAA